MSGPFWVIERSHLVFDNIAGTTVWKENPINLSQIYYDKESVYSEHLKLVKSLGENYRFRIRTIYLEGESIKYSKGRPPKWKRGENIPPGVSA